MAKRRRLGDFLLEAGAIDEQQLKEALDTQRFERRRRQLGTILISLGYLTDGQIANALAQQMGLPFVTLSTINIESRLSQIVPKNIMELHRVVPISFHDKVLTVAMADPTDIDAVDHLRTITGFRVERAVSTFTDIQDAIDNYFVGGWPAQGATPRVHLTGQLASPGEMNQATPLRPNLPDPTAGQMRPVATERPRKRQTSLPGEAGGLQIVNDAIETALDLLASDIHFLPTPGGTNIRYRVDGKLRDGSFIPSHLQTAAISRIKVMAQLDVTEHRRSQEGHARVVIKGREADLRVAIIPTLHGESAILRLLDQLASFVGLSQLGLAEPQLKAIERHLSRPQGMILLTGPTGCGKTTSLYSMIMQKHQPDVHIITLEDPVEYEIPGITQVSVDERAGLTFASGMKSLVRLDPDVIMVGEIRDAETAHIAFQAALTGHLVLSTLHTNDAISAVARLIHMGIEPYLLASALSLVIAQRLVRKVCTRCATTERLTPEEAAWLRIDPQHTSQLFRRGTGCDYCQNTGYRHRTAIFQNLEIDQGLKDLILARAPESQIRAYAASNGMLTLAEEGLARALAGVTTPDEVIAVTEMR